MKKTEKTKPTVKSALNTLLARYYKFGLTKNLKGKQLFGHFKCDDFILIRFMGIYLRICPNKDIYDNLPQAG